MTTESQLTSPKERVSTYLYFGSLYFVTVGVLYLWGYWSAFNINILEYISLADIVKSTAYPIASVVILSAVGAVAGELTFNPRALPPGGGRNTHVGKFLRKVGPFLGVAYMMGTTAFAFFGPVEKWNVLPMFFAVPLTLLAKEQGFLLELIPHDSPRSIVIFLLAVLPPLAYGQGQLKANDIVTGKKFDYVLSAVDGIEVARDKVETQRVRFLGHTGDFLFFLEPTKGTLAVAKFESNKSLVLRHFERPSSPAPSANPSSQRMPEAVR